MFWFKKKPKEEKKPVVLAVLTDEEVAEIQSLTTRKAALEDMIDAILKRMVDHRVENGKAIEAFWDNIKEKYACSGYLSINPETKELTKKV